MSAISSSPSSEYLFQETVVSACKGALKTWVILQCHHESQKMNKAFASANSLGKVEMSTETFLKTLGLAGLQMGLAVSALQDSFRIMQLAGCNEKEVAQSYECTEESVGKKEGQGKESGQKKTQR